jgi:acyl carrier protein
LAGENLLGVWHGAGVLENASLERQSWDVVHTVLRPKLDGAWNLHVLTLAKQLEFFVLFSSWASIDGAPGQINHSAANAFLDGLAHFRRTNGLPALSVNWGAWADVGSAAGDKLQRQLARSGMETMLPKDALETLRLTLALPDAQIAIASIRWHQYLARRRDGSSFYENLASQYDLRTRVQTTQNHSISVDRLRNKSGGLRGSSAPEEIRALPAVSRNAALIRKVAAVLRRTLGIREDEEIDRDLPFSALGMDSLLAIELRNSLSGLFHTQFPSTILFDYPTLRTLALYLEQELFTVDRASPVNGMKPSPLEKIASPSREIATGRDVLGILNMIEQMTDQEVESLDFRS